MLHFPCVIHIDAHGFVTDSTRSLTGFQFASKNTSMKLMREKSNAYVGSTAEHTELRSHFEKMTGQTFLQSWFQSHDEISELVGSGFQPKRTCSLVLYLEPENISAQELFDI